MILAVQIFSLLLPHRYDADGGSAANALPANGPQPPTRPPQSQNEPKKGVDKQAAKLGRDPKSSSIMEREIKKVIEMEVQREPSMKGLAIKMFFIIGYAHRNNSLKKT